MNLSQYQELKRLRQAQAPQYRPRCLACRNPKATCYCPRLKPFASRPEFLILIHPNEVNRRIATGRMAHLSLTNSRLIEGLSFTHSEAVNDVLADPRNYPVLLFPGVAATNLTPLSPPARRALFPTDKKLVVLVLDATWSQAKKMRRLSPNLHSLPQVCFSPRRLSGFGTVRHQPSPECYSTIEAIHEVMELLEEEEANSTPSGRSHLLEVFAHMVHIQTVFQAKGEGRRSKTGKRVRLGGRSDGSIPGQPVARIPSEKPNSPQS